MWVFRYVGNKTFDFSSKRKNFLPNNDQIWPDEIGIFVHCPLIWCPVGRLAGGCGARAVLARHLFTLYILHLCMGNRYVYEKKNARVKKIFPPSTV